MEPVNKPVKKRRGGRKNCKLTHGAPVDGHMFPAIVGRPEKLEGQDQSELHMACLYGQLSTIWLLVESRQGSINSGDLQGRRPVHMVLTPRSSPNTSSCLRYLLEHGANVNIKTDLGMTPLHLAASEGLLDCTEILVQAGADVSAQDSMGHTPLDLARVWCHRKVARYLKSCMWGEEKEKEMQERKLVQALYRELVDTARLNLHKNDHNKKTMAEWANKKGFPLLKDFCPRVLVSKYHTRCLQPDQSNPKHPLNDTQEDRSTKQPPSSSSRPWTIFMGLQPGKPSGAPDLRDSVTVRRGGAGRRLQYTTKWDSAPRPAPDLPLDVLQRALFPRAFPPRIASPRHFEPRSIFDVQQRGHPPGRSTSPWTEVAMHLAEVLEPGHY